MDESSLGLRKAGRVDQGRVDGFIRDVPALEDLLVRAVLDRVVDRVVDCLDQPVVLLHQNRNLALQRVAGPGELTDNLGLPRLLGMELRRRVRSEVGVDPAGLQRQVVVGGVLVVGDVGGARGRPRRSAHST